MLQKIISGGQTGADRAALDFAIEFDIPHGGWIPNRIKQGKNTLRWDKTSCRRFEANEARLKLGVIAYNFLTCSASFMLVGKG